MTNNIYPPDHLLRKWESLIIDEEQNVDVVLYEAFQAGADQELEACRLWVSENCSIYDAVDLSKHRRPKPPSLKEQAMAALDDAVMRGDCITISDALPKIRRALEALPND